MKRFFFNFIFLGLGLLLTSGSMAAVEYTGSAGRDPFGIGSTETSNAGATAVKAPPIASLKLDGIVWGGFEPRAIINGKMVKAGDQVSGFEIVEIKKDGVRLSRDGEEQILPQKSGQAS